MPELPHERLASLEAKIEFLKELLTEIRDDLKNQPTREEFNKLETRVYRIENNSISNMIKLGIASGILGMVGGLLMRFILS